MHCNQREYLESELLSPKYYAFACTTYMDFMLSCGYMIILLTNISLLPNHVIPVMHFDNDCSEPAYVILLIDKDEKLMM